MDQLCDLLTSEAKRFMSLQQDQELLARTLWTGNKNKQQNGRD